MNNQRAILTDAILNVAPSALGVLRGRGLSQEAAEDCFKDAVVIVFEQCANFPPKPEVLRPWIIKIAKTLANHYLTDRRKEKQAIKDFARVQAGEDESAADVTPEEAASIGASRQKTIQIVDDELNKLSDFEKEIALDPKERGWTRRLANKYKKTCNDVSVTWNRLQKKLKRIFQRKLPWL